MLKKLFFIVSGGSEGNFLAIRTPVITDNVRYFYAKFIVENIDFQSGYEYELSFQAVMFCDSEKCDTASDRIEVNLNDVKLENSTYAYIERTSKKWTKMTFKFTATENTNIVRIEN